MSARLLGALDRGPPWARRSLMIAVPLALLGALVAGFALAPTEPVHRSEPAGAAALVLPPSPRTTTQAHVRPAPPALRTGQGSPAAVAPQHALSTTRPRAARRPPVRGPVSEQPRPASHRSGEGMMLAVGRSFAVAYIPYQVGRLPQWARAAIERTCTSAFARYLLAQPAQLTPVQAAHPHRHRDLPGRGRRAGRGSGHGGGQIRLRGGQRRQRRVPAEAGHRARALAGR
jgi:hypothetical protein